MTDGTRAVGNPGRQTACLLGSYVPNVVYSCGSPVHGGKLFMPYAQADKTASMAVVDLDELLKSLIDTGP